MKIENKIFKKYSLIWENLLKYGFKLENDEYIFTKNILESKFKVIIKIDKNGLVNGKIIDLNLNDEYTNYRIENVKGEFINNIRNIYENILLDIRKYCFKENYFITSQANRITNLIITKYNSKPEFPWEKYDNYGIFRCKNGKWFALIMNINKNKIDEYSKPEEIEIINVKLLEDDIKKLIQKDGFYKAYHMNKNNWITISLDNTLNDEVIMNYVDNSFKIIENK
jgi:predicted DNA-binding protein (MmcQ/YjbR family)